MRAAGRLPNLVVAGVPKCGTTSLFSYLTSHPEVCGSEVKSTQYFLPLRYGRPLGDLDGYRARFAGCLNAPVVMEASPGYFYGGRAVSDALARTIPDVKVLIALREPVSRLVSSYRFQQSRTRIPLDLTFDEFVARCETIDPERFSPDRAEPGLTPWHGVQGGYYDQYLPDWMHFGDNVRFVFFEYMIRDARSTLAALAVWLGVDPERFPAEFPTENETVVPRRAGLQRRAMNTRKALDGVLRRSPTVRRALRRAYYRVNGRPATRPELGGRTDLAERYRSSNARTAELLRAAGVVDLPSWLDASSASGAQSSGGVRGER
jgi:hypothetical protein